MSFVGYVYPCLVLTYLGQGAYLLVNPDQVSNLFWACLPRPVFWPMFVAALLASIVASQALISGTFSIIRQVTMLQTPQQRAHLVLVSIQHAGTAADMLFALLHVVVVVCQMSAALLNRQVLHI
jgi:K+ transporter